MVSSCAVPSARMRRLRSRRRGRLVPPLLSDALLSHGLDVRGDRALVVRERLRLDLDHLRRVALGRHSAGPAASQALRGHHQRPSASRSDLEHIRDDVVKKAAVVRDDEDRRLARLQPLGQPDERGEVEVVRRLVEQQHLQSEPISI